MVRRQTDLSWTVGTVGFTVADDSMAPEYRRGELLMCNEVDPASLKPGRDCVIQVSGERRIAGTVRSVGSRLVLTSILGDTVTLDVPVSDVEKAWAITAVVFKPAGREFILSAAPGGSGRGGSDQANKKGRSTAPNDPTQLGGGWVERSFQEPAFAC
jgi:hypothetical protein